MQPRLLKKRTDNAQKLFNASLDLLFVLTAEGGISAVNPAARAAIGCPDAEIIGSNLLEWIHPEDRACTETQLRKLAEGTDVVAYVNRLRTASGSFLQLEWNCRGLSESGSQLFASARDVTNFRRLRADLGASELMKSSLGQSMRLTTLGELLVSIVHELKQPMQVISSLTAACELENAQSKPTNGRIRKMLQDVRKAGIRAGEIMNRARRFVSSNQERSPVQLNQTIDDSVQLLAGEITRSQVSVVLDLSEDLAEVWGEPLMLQLVLVNLIRNACEAMRWQNDSRRELTISSMNDSERVEIRLTDTGPGMDDATHARLFEFQFTTKADGEGMGLHWAKKIIDGHHGQISCESRAGGGASFHITLPRKMA